MNLSKNLQGFFKCVIVLPLLYSCSQEVDKPNVVIIYTDDIGYGDVGIYGADQIPTPNIDKLAIEGLRFTDAHCAASTCSPSRYALLTGVMGFRDNVAIQGINSPALIQPSKFTMGNIFQQAGYATAIVGKWHLGIGSGDIDWNGELTPCPLDAGFDYSFVIPHSNDRAPFVYLENRKVYNLDPNDPITVAKRRIPDSIPGTTYPDAILNPESVTVYTGDRAHQATVINGVGRIGYMKGGKSALWNDHDIAFDLLKKAEIFITDNKDNPFFLLFSTNDIHAPRLPNPRFKGTTDLGYRGDNIVQLDFSVGQIMGFLQNLNIDKKTLVIFTSDNGPVKVDGGYQDGSDLGDHKASGIYRGGKYSVYEGGTRVPFIVNWPSVVEPGISKALVSQVDLLASFAAFFNIQIPKNAAIDSRNYWNVFIGNEDKGAEMILEQANRSEDGIALRKEHMKFIRLKDQNFEMYDLSKDPSEEVNLIDSLPEIAKSLQIELEHLLDTGLTRYSSGK